MNPILIIVLVFILISPIGFADGVYKLCHQEVDNDKSLTFADNQIQKQNCNTYNDRYGNVLVCVEEFGFSLNTSEKYGIYDEQVLDLGTKLQLNGVGACNSTVELKLEKNGSNVADLSTTYAFFSGEFSKQYLFSRNADIGQYTLTATKQTTGEEHVVNFSVKSINESPFEIQLNFEDFKERLITFEQRLLLLESELEKRDQIIIEQIKLITSLTNTSN